MLGDSPFALTYGRATPRFSTAISVITCLGSCFLLVVSLLLDLFERAREDRSILLQVAACCELAVTQDSK